MPRIADGTYSLPEPDVLPGQVIASEPYNNTLADLAQAMTNSARLSILQDTTAAGPNTTTTGTTSALAFTSNAQAYPLLKTGLVISFRSHVDATVGPTFQLDTLAAKPLVKMTSAYGILPTQLGEIRATGVYSAVYDETISPSGAWIVLNPTLVTVDLATVHAAIIAIRG